MNETDREMIETLTGEVVNIFNGEHQNVLLNVLINATSMVIRSCDVVDEYALLDEVTEGIRNCLAQNNATGTLQ